MAPSLDLLAMNSPLTPRGATIEPFYAGEIGMLAMARMRAGRPVIPMHFGQPSAGIPTQARAAAHASLDRDSSGYWLSAALRERIARHYGDTYGVDVAPERVLLTSGASAGLVTVFAALFAAGDRIGLARPGYPAYRNALKALGRTAVEIDCGAEARYRLRPEMLDASAEPLHGLIIASPANPTGAMLSRDQLGELVARCRRDGTRVVSDEIYHGVCYGTAPEATTALALEPEAIVLNSFSKLFRMPGWRLGWIVAPANCVRTLNDYLTNLFLVPSSLAQHAALAAFDDMPELVETVAQYARNRDCLLTELARLGLRGIAPPDGAFYLYADVGHLTDDSLAFCRRLVDETGVAIAPGIDFDPIHGHRHLRISFAISASEVEQALALLGPWLAQQPRLR
jgi:aspartate/methionine/tyrosine aminotransferase